MVLGNEALYEICFRILKLTTPSFGEPESPNFFNNVWGDLLPEVSRAAEFRPKKAISKPDSISKTSLFYGGICTPYIKRIAAIILLSIRFRLDTTNVGCQEHEVCS